MSPALSKGARDHAHDQRLALDDEKLLDPKHDLIERSGDRGELAPVRPSALQPRMVGEEQLKRHPSKSETA